VLQSHLTYRPFTNHRECDAMHTFFLFSALLLPAAEPATDLYGDPLPQGAVARMGSTRLRHSAAAVAFAPDGKSFATAGQDRMIRLWDTASGKEIRVFKGHASSVSAVGFSADGKKLYSAGFDGTIREWDAAEAKELQSIKLPPNPRGSITGLAVHPTEARLVTMDAANVTEWDLKEKKSARTVAYQPGSIVALCPDGKHYAAFNGTALTLRDLDDKEVHNWALGTRRVMRLAFSADGATVAAGLSDLSVVFWDVKTGREIRTLTTVNGVTGSLAVSATGRYFATKPTGTSVRIFGVASGQELRQFDTPNVFGGLLAFSPDGKRFASCQGYSIYVWDLDTSRPLHEFAGHGNMIDGVRFSPDGKQLTSGGRDGLVIRWDAATGRAATTWTAPTTASGIVVAPEGRTFYYPTASGIWRGEFLDGKTAEKQVVSEMNFFPNCLAVSPDGKLLAVRGRDRTIRIHSSADGKELGKLPPEVFNYLQFAFSPDGKQLVAASGNTVQFFEVPSANAGQVINVAAKNPGLSNVTTLRYSLDGKGLLVVTFQGVALYEAAAGRERWRAPQKVNALNSGTISPDGRLAAVGNATGSVFVLDTATGEPLAELTGHAAAVRALDFSPDGKRLASACDDGTLLVWDTAEFNKKVRPGPVKLTQEQVAGLWADLGGADSAKANQAVRALADSPQGVAHLKANAKGGDKFDEARAKKIIAKLDDDDFDTREQASKDLAGMGAAVVPLLREALKNPPSAEVKTRLERLLEGFKDLQVSVERLRSLRLVESLEFAETADALKTLKTLAGGGETDSMAQDAKAALERLERRGVKP
jgi:WD40 repeat protein